MKIKIKPPVIKPEIVDKEADIYLTRNNQIKDLNTAKAAQINKIKVMGQRFGKRSGKCLLVLGNEYEIGLMFREGRISVDTNKLWKLLLNNSSYVKYWHRMIREVFDEDKFRKLLTSLPSSKAALLQKFVGKCIERGNPVETVVVKRQNQAIQEEYEAT